MLSSSGISARILIRKYLNDTVEAMTYTASITTSFLDASGNAVHSWTYSSSDYYHYVDIYTTTVQNYPDTIATSITGLNFIVKLKNLRKSGQRETASLQLRGLTVGRFASITSAVPEPSTWAMMLLGFAMIGAASRYRRRTTIVVYA